jgi:cytochrome c oxidase subunit 3
VSLNNANTPETYFVPKKSYWPILGAIGLFTTVVGIINWVHGHHYGPLVFLAGAVIIAFMMYGWFSSVIQESLQNLYSKQVDISFRFSMAWFIVSEVMFFLAFFGALFYARTYSVPWLGGIGSKVSTHTLLWEHFEAAWPLLQNPNPSKFIGPKEIIDTWGIPALNTLILLSSGVTMTIAHYALKENQRLKLLITLLVTVVLGSVFLTFQAYEYHHAYTKLGLTLNSGIYGTTFFMLTGFHGAHVAIGTLMLLIMLFRCFKGHFTSEKHFAFEAAAWYWHFVDVIWLFLFIFVYWL